jgi:cytoskeleton protein RodZ
VLRAKSETWLQVREPKGPVLLNRVLRAGDAWVVPAKPNLVLSTGNAAGTEVLVDGVLAPLPGAGGTIRRNIPLDADALKAVAQAAGAAPQPAAAGPGKPTSSRGPE